MKTPYPFKDIFQIFFDITHFIVSYCMAYTLAIGIQ